MEKIVKTEGEWRELLGDEAFQVCRQAGTERAFTGEYWDCKTEGDYHCRACNTRLFSSATKYESGSGWPSFYDLVDADAAVIRRDESHGMVREELVCAACESHLGHRFPDGPAPTGLRYCINSLSIKLEPKL